MQEASGQSHQQSVLELWAQGTSNPFTLSVSVKKHLFRLPLSRYVKSGGDASAIVRVVIVGVTVVVHIAEIVGVAVIWTT